MLSILKNMYIHSQPGIQHIYPIRILSPKHILQHSLTNLSMNNNSTNTGYAKYQCMNADHLFTESIKAGCCWCHCRCHCHHHWFYCCCIMIKPWNFSATFLTTGSIRDSSKTPIFIKNTQHSLMPNIIVYGKSFKQQSLLAYSSYLHKFIGIGIEEVLLTRLVYEFCLFQHICW